LDGAHEIEMSCDVCDVHDEHGQAQRAAERRSQAQQSRGETLDAGAAQILPRGEDHHRRDYEEEVAEVDDRVGRCCGLRAEVDHEPSRGCASVDKHERRGDRKKRGEEHGDAHGDPHEPGAVLVGLHDASTEKEDPGHQQPIRNEGRDIRPAKKRIGGEVDGVDVQGHCDGNREGSVGDASIRPFAAEDEQARHERPHERRDERLDHPKISE
jgi:hypothetical protein